MKTETESREIAICGYNAVTAVLSVNPQRVKRLFFTPVHGRKMGEFCRMLARERKFYKQTNDPEELERLASTVHHGGVVAVAAVPAPAPVYPEDVAAWSRAGEPMLILDRVGNAHNLGALVRSAAYFGVPRVILAERGQQAFPGPAAFRVAEGAMEHVDFHSVRDLAGFCRSLGGHFRVIGTDSGKAVPLPEPGVVAGWKEPVALVMGNEENGLSAETREACRSVYQIPGCGRIESLNVSAAGAVFMHAFFHGGAT